MEKSLSIFNIKIPILILGVLLMQTLHASPRPSAVAGSFYSADKKELSEQIEKLLSDIKETEHQSINAIIVPHAGYVYSAPTAAKAYKTLHKKYKNIFLIGSSHHVNINGASIYTLGNYKTPLGEVQVNQTITSQLIQDSKLFTYHPSAHTKEHTLEVQLPFLQTIYGEDLNIVPIIIATHDTKTIFEISKVLKPYFTEENLFVISTDLSHFPSYDDANIVDMKTLNAIVTNDTNTFINTLATNEQSSLANLQTSACGWASVLMLMNLTQDLDYKYEILEYINSGDTTYGDKQRVVGYGAIKIYKEAQGYFLNAEEKEQLRAIALLALEDAVLKNKRVSIDKSKVYPKLQDKLGAFVTLYKNGNLRGCIGRFEPNEKLYEVVVDMAIAAALHDTRFNKVSSNELSTITLEISVLTPRRKINSIDEIILGKHGIYVQKGTKNGTYLPHVATQMNWSIEEFVRSCAVEKAGISPDEIETIEIFVYEAIVF